MLKETTLKGKHQTLKEMPDTAYTVVPPLTSLILMKVLPDTAFILQKMRNRITKKVSNCSRMKSELPLSISVLQKNLNLLLNFLLTAIRMVILLREAKEKKIE